MTGPQEAATRKADSLALWATPAIDVWVVTATSRTARDVTGSGRARLAVGPTRDVTMVDAVLDRAVPVDEDAGLGAAYAAQADWDPRGNDGYVFLVLRPERVQAWREADEISGRTLMRDGAWLV